MLLKHISRYSFSVRVRYAPSPTGPMHLGAVRTALFNYLFAKHNNGKFILRIQDTDIERNIQGSTQDILDTLDWLGISPNQSARAGGNYGPYIQSQRIDLYKQVANNLLRRGAAYACFCQHEKSKPKINKDNNDNEQSSSYDGRCRNLQNQEVISKIKNGEKYAIRIKSDKQQLKVNSFKDEIYGQVTCTKFDDFILIKNNGYPTYHFANVIDDWKMEITHVMRGVQWLTNTSKHLYLYNVLEKKPPAFIHLPLVFTADGRKLSKRDPTAPINNLKLKGYLPQAIINYTALLGFSPKLLDEPEAQVSDKKKKNPNELQSSHFSLQQLCRMFQLSKIKNSPIKSDNKKLNYFNRYYIKKKLKQKNQHFLNLCFHFFRSYFQLQPESSKYKENFILQVIQCTSERVNNIQEFGGFQYFFKKPNFNSITTKDDIIKILGPKTTISQNQGKILISGYDNTLMQKSKKILHNLRIIFVHVLSPAEYTQQKIAQQISKYLFDNKQLVNQDVYHLLRLAVTGRKSGVGIVKTCWILGQDRVQEDLQYLSNLFSGDCLS